MTISQAFVATITGTSPFRPDAISEAIEYRFNCIRHRMTKKGTGDYSGNRTEPANLGWRFVQMFGEKNPQAILDGEFDREIEDTWHEAADSERWYREEKDWGW